MAKKETKIIFTKDSVEIEGNAADILTALTMGTAHLLTVLSKSMDVDREHLLEGVVEAIPVTWHLFDIGEKLSQMPNTPKTSKMETMLSELASALEETLGNPNK